MTVTSSMNVSMTVKPMPLRDSSPAVLKNGWRACSISLMPTPLSDMDTSSVRPDSDALMTISPILSGYACYGVGDRLGYAV